MPPAAHEPVAGALAHKVLGSVLCVGDMISLYVEDLNGFLAADGLTDNSLNVKCLREDEICVPSFESCVFQVQVKQNYHAKVELESWLAQLGIFDASKADKELNAKQREHYERLCARVRQEERQNEEDTQIYLGRPLRFSTPIQLLHAKSRKYVKVCLDNAADAEGSNIAVILTNSGAASCFRFKSRHSLKLADDAVCNLDLVFVVPEELVDTHFLNCDTDLSKIMHTCTPKLTHRVSALLTGMTCLVQKYARPRNEHSMHNSGPMPGADGDKSVPLRGGQVVRLFHPTLDVFLATNPSMISGNALILLEDGNGFDQPGASTKLEQPSAYSMWIVENADPTRGSDILFDQPIRLRNLATDGYLLPHQSKPAVISKQIVSWSVTGHSKRTVTSSICTFGRLPENSADDPLICKHTVIWLHFPHSGAGEESMWLHTAGSASSPVLELCKQIGPTDGFRVCPVDDGDLRAPFQIVSVAHAVKEYILLIKESGFCPHTAVQTERIISILQDLMKIFNKAILLEKLYKSSLGKSTDSAGTKPFDDAHMATRENLKVVEREIYKSQSVIRELQLMDNLMELVDFHTWSVIHQRHTIKDLRYNMDMSLARNLCEVAFQLLSLSTRDNQQNGVHLSYSIEILLYHYTGFEGSAAREPEVRYLNSLKQCIIDIYRDNSLVLSSLDSKSLRLFVNMLVGQQQLSPTFVRFLSVLVEHKQKSVIHSVRMLCDLLLDEPAQASLPMTTIRGNEILVCMPNIGGVPMWLPVQEVFRDPLSAEYYNEFINLVSIMCCGRTKTTEKILRRLIDASVTSVDLCIAFVLRDSIPYRTRGLYAQLLREAFIDCNPQQCRCHVDVLAVWSDLHGGAAIPNEPFPAQYGGNAQPMKIKDKLLEFIENHDVQGLDPERDNFGLSIINLLHHMVYFGFFNHTAEWVMEHEFIHRFPRYKGRIEALLRYLDPEGGIDDVNLDKKTIEIEILVQPILLMLDPSTDYRLEGNPRDETLIKTKMMICTILDLICRVRQRVRINRLLQVYDADLQAGLVFACPHAGKDQSALERDSKYPTPKLESLRPDFEQVLTIIMLDKVSLTKMLGELLKYGDEALDNRALKLMLRIYSERHELCDTLQLTVLLVNPAVINAYYDHRAILRDLEEMVLTLGLIVEEVAFRAEDARLERIWAEQQTMLQEDDDALIAAEAKSESGGLFGLMGGLTSLSETMGDLSKGISGIAHVGEGLTEGLTAGLGLGSVFEDKEKKKQANLRANVSMIARMNRRGDNKGDTKKRGTSRPAKKLTGEQQDEAMREIEDPKKKSLVRSLHREKLDADRELTLVLKDNCNEIRRRISSLVRDCSPGGSNLPLIKLQHGLMDLRAHIRVLDIVRAINRDLDLLEYPEVFELLKDSCRLMTWFVKNNVRNAALINTESDMILKMLDHPRALDFGVDEVLASLYNNNRSLCAQAPQKLEQKVMSLICGTARRFPYLKMLTALMCPNGFAIKRNQTRILKMLQIQKSKTLNLFEGDEGLNELKLLIRRREYAPKQEGSHSKSSGGRSSSPSGRSRSPRPTEKEGKTPGTEKQARAATREPQLYDAVLNVNKNFDSEVLYYLYTIKLFTVSCSSNNFFTEQICCRMIPTRRCVELITPSWCLGELKVAALEFLLEAHILREKMSTLFAQNLAHEENMWVLFEYFATMLYKIMDPNEKRSYCMPKETPAMTMKITGLFLSIGKVFFTCFRLKYASTQELKIGNHVCDAIVKYWGECSKDATEQRALAELLHAMEHNGIRGNDATRRLIKTLLGADKINLLKAVNTAKSAAWYTKESGLFPIFIENFKTRIHVESEMTELIQVCREHARSVHVITEQLTSVRVDNWLKQKYINILQKLWENLTDKTSRIDKNIEAIRLDVVISALMQLVSKGTEISACLELCISLLTRGGRPVQKCFLAALSQRGPAESFFREISSRIELACEETRERKAILAQVVSNARPERGVKQTIEQLMSLYKGDDDQVGSPDLEAVSDVSHIEQVLGFLKNLCEGHYWQMQLLMRHQEQDHDFDLVKAVAMLVIENAESVSPLNIDLTIQGFETLTEFMQGPNKGNIFQLLKTSIFDAINLIMRNLHTDLEGVHYPQEYLEKVRRMKSAVITSLLAMMEASSGTELKVPIAIMESLDLHEVFNYAVHMHRIWNLNLTHQLEAGLKKNDPVLQKINSVTIATGFQCYILLRALADFDSVQTSSVIAPEFFKSLQNTALPAINYYSNQVGSLEIARETRMRTTEIIRVYFQVPAICSRITRKMKDDILWTVDRTNDVTRLRDYFSRVDDLYYQMKYQELLDSNNITLLIKKIGRLVDTFYFLNVFLINLLMLIYFRWREPLETDPDATWQEMKHVDLQGPAAVALESVLPSVQLVLEFIMVLHYTMSRVPIFVRKQFKEAHIEADKTDADGNKIPFDYDTIPRNFRFAFNYVRFALRDNNFVSGQCFVWRVVTLSISLAINLYTVTSTTANANIALLWYFVLLWEVFPRSKQIGFVLKAVIMGGSQLLALFGMLLVFTYWFGVIGWIAFPDKYQFRKSEVVDGSTVQNSVESGWGNNRAVPLQTVWHGMIMVVDQGVRKDDVGEALDKFQWPAPCPNPAEYGCKPCDGLIVTYDCVRDRSETGSAPCLDEGWLSKLDGYLQLTDCADVFTSWPQAKIFIRVIYTFMFFVMVSAIGLEIVFGIIVDSFKALREEREETEKDIKYKCFICGINRDVFDSRLITSTGGKTGFDKHTEDDHNMWVYMYFLIHIREIEDKTELNGVESYVWELSKANDVSFFPVGRSMRLDVTGGLTDPMKEAYKRKEQGIQSLELKSQWWNSSINKKLEKLMLQHGLTLEANTQKTDVSAASQRASNAVQLTIPDAVKEDASADAGAEKFGSAASPLYRDGLSTAHYFFEARAVTSGR